MGFASIFSPESTFDSSDIGSGLCKVLRNVGSRITSVGFGMIALALTSTVTKAATGEEASPPPQINVIWEWSLSNYQQSPLPTLSRQTIEDPEQESWDGSSSMDSYGGLQRYNEDWLLLAIRENGVNESAPEDDAAAELAVDFPDRSLIWIDSETGEPLGLALKVGLTPVALDSDFLTAGGSSLDYYFTFDVTDDGSALIGYKNLILEYRVTAATDPATNGFPEFGPPRIIYRQPDDGSPFWPDWRWASIESRGSGSDLKIIATGKTWRPGMGPIFLETTDGSNFEATWNLPSGFEAASGGVSFPYQGMLDGRRVGQWVYASSYPGASDGLSGAEVYRYLLAPSFGGSWSLQESLDLQLSGLPSGESESEAHSYSARFISEVALPETLGGISDWIVVYSTPSYNSELLGIAPPSPAWLALHPNSGGSAIATHSIPVDESMELIPSENNPTALFHATHGTLRTSIPPRAKQDTFEILWSSGIYGYGRYLVGELEPPPVPPEIGGISVNQRGVIVYWDLPMGRSYQLQRTTSLQNPDWQNIGSPTQSIRVIDRNPPQGNAFYRILVIE